MSAKNLVWMQAVCVVMLSADPGCVGVDVSGGSVLEGWSSSILNRGSVCLVSSTIDECVGCLFCCLYGSMGLYDWMVCVNVTTGLLIF